jgi:acyl carrier protein
MSPFIDKPGSASSREVAANKSLMLDVREIVATHFGIPLDRLTHETHFSSDLGADHFDLIELMIAIEDQVSGIAINAMTIDGIENIGDVMRAIEGLQPVGLGPAPQVEG